MDNDGFKKLIDNFLSKASDEDKLILGNVLGGMKNKVSLQNSSYIGSFLGMEKILTEYTCQITIPLTSLINNNLGIVHGGIIATLADSAMGILANEAAPEGSAAVTTQLNTHYLSPGIGSSLSCTARFVHKGSQTMVLEADVFRDDGKKAAYSTGSFFILRKS
ncbi:PaaI family thioesterase [Mesobacillus zeae]|uniref:PaaI family thioesterase n=1 Tax=Mesobacillus zeae TaxID=1917180 RepID=A0A398BDI8_9BACI|nr:PaaI family thioesterase [Mesobacillus zeae]RID87877.1 PaaI family thioesterase [Mesobacillus zeae]